MVRSNTYTRLTVVRSGHGLRLGGHAGQIERFRGKRMDLEVSVEPCIPPVNTVPHNGQIERLGGKRMDLEVSVEPCIPPVNTVPHNGQIERLHTTKEEWLKARGACWSDRTLARKEEGLRAHRGTFYSNCQHSTSQWSDRTLTHALKGKRHSLRLAGQIEPLRVNRWDLELSAELSIPSVNPL